MKDINLKTACAKWRYIQSDKATLAYHRKLEKDYGWDESQSIALLSASIADDRAALEEDASYVKLAAAISEAEGRAKERRITAEEVVQALCEIEDKLGISKKALEGVLVMADLNAQSFPSAYKWAPQSTWFYAYYKSGSWRISAIRRERTAQRKNGVTIGHTEASKAALLERFSSFSL